MNDKEFESYMVSLDAHLKDGNVAIHARPFVALSRAARDLKRSIMIGDPFADRMHSWFATTYGERLKLKMGLGRSVVLVMGDSYAVDLPLCFGRIEADPLDLIQDTTPALLARLGDGEVDELRVQISEIYRAYNLKSHLPPDACSWVDVDNAVGSILGHPPNYGVSRFSSLQVAEKALKGFIRTHGGMPPTYGKKGHDLQHLQEMAEKLSVPKLAQNHIIIPSHLIDPISCGASARYPGDKSSLEQAVTAHHASINLCAFLVSNANFIDQN